MELKLNIYTDETLTEIKRVAESDRLKVPYRVAIYIGQSLENMNLKKEEDILKFISSNIDKLDKIIKATFGVSESELDCIEVTDLASVGVELYKWAIEKFNSIKSDNSKN